MTIIHPTEQEFEAMIDTTLEDTFPASDPPAWTLGREPLSRGGAKSNAMIDTTLEDTFPASDPPAWTLGRDA